MQHRTLTTIIIVLIVLMVFVAFIVYSRPAHSTTLGASHTPAHTALQTPQDRFDASGGFMLGSIESLNDDGLTITMQDGSTKKIVLTATTTIQTFEGTSSVPSIISVNQLSVGEQARIFGEQQNDGSVVASRVLVKSAQ